MAHIGRSVKNVEAPRPLKSQSRSSLKNNFMLIEELIQLIENVAISLQNGINNTEPMATLVQNLRIHGPQLETVSKDTLDRAFVVFRNASQDERLNIMTRLNLLELIELRAKGWEDSGINSYYKTKQATNAEVGVTYFHFFFLLQFYFEYFEFFTLFSFSTRIASNIFELVPFLVK